MMTQPQIWHYGLVARDWAEFQTDGGAEASYFRTMIDTFGQPALDLGCGTGRLLLPYLAAGLDVDGCDYSKDMLAQCQERAAREGLTPRLFQQATYELDLSQRYRTIFACGVIGLGGDRRLTMQAMQRCYEHLRPGGAFVFDYSPRWNDPPAWLSRLPEVRHSLPDEWPSPGNASVWRMAASSSSFPEPLPWIHWRMSRRARSEPGYGKMASCFRKKSIRRRSKTTVSMSWSSCWSALVSAT